LDKKCSSDVTTVTRAGSSPISSFDSLNAVAASSASPSSAFPPGNATSPENYRCRNQIQKKEGWVKVVTCHVHDLNKYLPTSFSWF
jgi:hypothetical protein